MSTTSRKGAEAQRVKTWFVMVLDPWTGKWKRVGRAYRSKEAARSWVPFVRAAWRGCSTKVASCTLWFRDGSITPKTVEVLDKKFNMDPPAELPVTGNHRGPDFQQQELRASAPLREDNPEGSR